VTRPLLLALLLAGCASAPPERFYALSSGLQAAAAAPSARTVIVAPAALPDVVDRPQLVDHRDPNRVAILDQQRWAEPLRGGVARVVAEDLGQLLGTGRVSTREDVIRSPDCRVNLDVRRFDARAGTATVELLWTVACAGAPRQLGRSLATERIAGADTGATVAAYGRALDTVSREIAAGFASQVAATP
jgi:uncharacterized lipoprotein YmbA